MIKDLLHDLIAHPFEKRYEYEVHSINAVLDGFSDETLVSKTKLACCEIDLILGFEQTERTQMAIAKSFDRDTDEHILIKREGSVIKPLGASIDDFKGKTRVKRLQSEIKALISNYEKQSGHKLREVTVKHG